MRDWVVVWDPPDDVEGNVQHIEEHGLTIDEIEEVLLDESNMVGQSRSTHRPIVFGETSTGKYVAVVFEEVLGEPTIIYPITAFVAPRPRTR